MTKPITQLPQLGVVIYSHFFLWTKFTFRMLLMKIPSLQN